MYPLLNPSTRALVQWAKSTGVLVRVSPSEAHLPRPSLATLALLRRIYAVCVQNWFIKTAQRATLNQLSYRIFSFSLMKPHKTPQKK